MQLVVSVDFCLALGGHLDWVSNTASSLSLKGHLQGVGGGAVDTIAVRAAVILASAGAVAIGCNSTYDVTVSMAQFNAVRVGSVN